MQIAPIQAKIYEVLFSLKKKGINKKPKPCATNKNIALLKKNDERKFISSEKVL